MVEVEQVVLALNDRVVNVGAVYGYPAHEVVVSLVVSGVLLVDGAFRQIIYLVLGGSLRVDHHLLAVLHDLTAVAFHNAGADGSLRLQQGDEVHRDYHQRGYHQAQRTEEYQLSGDFRAAVALAGEKSGANALAEGLLFLFALFLFVVRGKSHIHFCHESNVLSEIILRRSCQTQRCSCSRISCRRPIFCRPRSRRTHYNSSRSTAGRGSRKPCLRLPWGLRPRVPLCRR